MRKVDIWTDGSSLGNGKDGSAGGIGAILIDPVKNKEREISKGYPNSTNNQMELLAAITGLELLRYPCEVKLMTDSQYVINCIEKWMPNWKNNGWKTAKGAPVKNQELIIRLDKMVNYHEVEFVKVKAHCGIEYNERVDKLAKQGALSVEEA